MRVECTNCRHAGDVPPEYAGRTIRCKRCRMKFVAAEKIAPVVAPFPPPVTASRSRRGVYALAASVVVILAGLGGWAVVSANRAAEERRAAEAAARAESADVAQRKAESERLADETAKQRKRDDDERAKAEAATLANARADVDRKAADAELAKIAADKVAADQKKRRRDYDLLPQQEQLMIDYAKEALRKASIDKITDDVALQYIARYPNQFPGIDRGLMIDAIVKCGNKKGALRHIESLRITNDAHKRGIQIVYASNSEYDCGLFGSIADQIARFGLTGLSDESKLFVRTHRDLYPD